MIAPCQNCNDRKLNCHSDCEKYKEFRQFKDKMKQIKMENFKENSYFADISKKKHEKYMKRGK